jgi:glycosyltransferase involved in cell wall biosynthesis
MKIAFIGARGIPDHYASAEQLVRHVGKYLVSRGHEFTVYCHAYRFEDKAPSWNGIRRIFIPTIPNNKYLTQIVHATLSSADTLRRDFDLVHYQCLNNSYQSIIPWMFGRKVVTNVDGQIWDDPKWPRRIRGPFFKSAARVAIRTSQQIITDAIGISDIYKDWYGKDSAIIEYGADIRNPTEPERIAKYGLTPKEYYFIAARLVPSNSADLIVDALKKSGSKRQLVIAGGGAFGSEWFEKLKRDAGPQVKFLGPVADQDDLDQIYANAYGYLHGASLGGVNSALLRPLGCALPCLALDTVYNREVLEMRDGRLCGRLWRRDTDDLVKQIREVDANPELARELGAMGQERIREAFTWERIGRQYEVFYEGVLAGHDIVRIRDDVAAV